jgi:hypothetical protein
MVVFQFQRVAALGSVLISALWYYRWESVRAFLYEWAFSVLSGYANLAASEWVAHFGVPAIFLILGFWLFWGTLPRHDVRAKIKKILNGSGHPAYEDIWFVCTHFTNWLRAKGGIHHNIARLLQNGPLRDAERAMTELQRVIIGQISSSALLQKTLGEYCQRYQSLMMDIRDIGMAVEYNFKEDGSFLKWVAEDDAFSREVWELASEEPQYSLLMKLVRGWLDIQGFAMSRSLKENAS